MIDHPDPVELVAFARGGLDDDRRSAIAEHCRSCSRCGDQLAAILLLRQGEGADVASRRAAARRRWPRAVAAAVVVAVALGLLAHLAGLDPFSSPVATGGNEAPVAGNGDEAPVADSAEARELAALATDEPPPGVIVTVEFGIPRVADSPDAGLREGLTSITRGEYGDAIAVLREVREGGTGPAMADAFLGMALYLSGDDSREARSLLAEGTRHDRVWVRDWSQWYLANLHLRRGEPAVARALLVDLRDDLDTTALADPVDRVLSRLP